MNVLVTGGSGFIGKHLVTALRKENHTVTTLPHTYLTEHPEALGSAIPQQLDWIFHLAAYGNMNNQTDEFDIFSANLAGTFNLLQATKDIPYKAFINVSTSSVTLPHQTMYSATKLGAEALCRAYVDEYQKPIITVRPYSVYGPGEAPFRFIPTVFRSCLTGEKMKLVPDAVHDWIYVDDLILRMISLCKLPNASLLNFFNSGTGVATHNSEVVQRIEEITGKKANYELVESLRVFDTHDWTSDPLIGPYTTLKEGLQKYYESLN